MLAALQKRVFSGFGCCLHDLGRMAVSKSEGKGKIISSWVNHTPSKSRVWTFLERAGERCHESDLPPGQNLSFNAWYHTYLLLKSLHISTVWLIFHMDCYKRVQHRHGGPGGLCYGATAAFCSQSPVAGSVELEGANGDAH